MRLTVLFCFLALTTFAQPFSQEEIARWEERAARTTIIRDNWGIPHIYAPTDADAVFGMLYVQCEDDFPRIERNYLDAIGRMAEAYGPEFIYNDLRARMYTNPVKARALYAQSPGWLQKLCDAFADGINYYLYTHPEVRPDLLTRFEPWMPFTFSEGSIGGDITRISTRGLRAFYEETTGYVGEPVLQPWEEAQTGSNGFAIGPEITNSGNALLLINPHTSFYFRSEMQVTSDEGLQAYGAVTWGQFFIYQGFNETCGWMHTSTRADAIDLYEETVEKRGDAYYYRYGKQWKPVTEERVSIPYREGETLQFREFTIYRTHHGPIIRREGDRWISFRMMDRPVDALRQSFLRTKADGYEGFRKTMKIRTNSSNNTVFADKYGNIAYWHGNFIPRRNPAYDYSDVVDGSDPDQDWQGLLKLKQTIEVRNPANHWIQNCNSTPYTVAGPASPSPDDYPFYAAPDMENFRGINAVRVLENKQGFDLDKLIEAANDPYLAAFEKTIPALVAACQRTGKAGDPRIEAAAQLLAGWDFNRGINSVPTAIAIYWGERVWRLIRSRYTAEDQANRILSDEAVVKHVSDREMVDALQEALDQLEKDFGSWRTPWGEINRFQRLTGNIEEAYDDKLPSIPVGFTSSSWGSLAAYNTSSPANVVRRYGRSGNSFVAVVEFGETVRARAVVSGGQSGDPNSPHFTDQAELFCQGAFRPVHFYRSDVEKNAGRTYRPGTR